MLDFVHLYREKYLKNIRKCYIMKQNFLNNFLKEKHSVYKKSFCIDGERRMKEMRGRWKKEVKKRENGNVCLITLGNNFLLFECCLDLFLHCIRFFPSGQVFVLS